MTNQLRNQKDTLAKLMATEDLTIIHKKIPTAYFDVQNRILACPILKDDISSELYDLFMGHEVGHALYTPYEGLHSTLKENRTLKGYLNVVEDVRIESFIKNKYQGLRKSFFAAYKELMGMDFFQLKGKDLNSLSLIDRINLTTKVGSSLGIQFTAEEEVLLNKCYGCKTWDDVVVVAKELYEWSKENETRTEDDQAIVPQMFDLGDEEEGEEDFGDMEDYNEDDFESSEDSMPDINTEEEDETEQEATDAEFEDGESQDTKQEEGEEEKKETGAKVFQNGAGGGDYDDEDGARESLTEHAAHNNEGQFLSEDNVAIVNIDMGERFKTHKEVLQNAVHGYKKVFADWDKFFGEKTDSSSYQKNYDKAVFTGSKLIKKNKNLVAHMAKEFDMKQTAQRSVHAFTGKTGKLDMNRLAKYQIVDDVFKRATYLPDGKNHGVTVLLDWSGSIHDAVGDLLEQSVILAEFCRKVNIPFRIYAFSDQVSHKNDDYGYRDTPKLVELMTNEMNNREFKKMMIIIGALWNSYANFNNSWRNSEKCIERHNEWFDGQFSVSDYWDMDMSHWTPWNYRLGGTPLDQSIVYLRKLLPEFNKAYGIEKSILTVITDGYSHSADILERNDKENDDLYKQFGDEGRWSTTVVTKIVDPYNKKTYLISENDGYSRTSFDRTQNLLQWVSDTTGVTVTGYFALSKKRDYDVLLSQLPGHDYYRDTKSEWAQIRKEGLVMNIKGYNKLFLTQLSTMGADGEDSLSDELVDANKSRILSAFKKNQKSKTTSRFLTNEFIKEIA